MKLNSEKAADLLSALAEFSVVKARPDGKFSIHRLTQEVVRNFDKKNLVRNKIATFLNQEVEKVEKSGCYFQAYHLIPHLMHLQFCYPNIEESEQLNIVKMASKWANYILKSGNYSQAESVLKTLLTRVEESALQKSHIHAEFLGQLAKAYHGQDKVVKAEKLYKDSLDIEKQAVGENHPAFSKKICGLAETLRSQGKYPEAKRAYLHAIKLDKRNKRENLIDYAKHINKLSVAFLRFGFKRPALSR